MAARSAVVDDILAQLEGAYVTPRARIDSQTTTDTTISFAAGGDQVRPGDYIEVEDEVQYVEAEVQPDEEFAVLRAQRGTTAAQHNTANTLARVNPRWFKFEIIDRLWDEIVAMPTDLHAVTEVDLSWGADTDTVALSTSTPSINSDVRVLGIRQAYREALAGDTRENRVSLELIRDGLNGDKVQIKEQGWAYQQAVTVRCAIAHTFDTATWATSTDLESDIGLSASMIAGVRLGTMARLQSTRELAQARVAAIGQSVEREGVPLGAQIEIGRELQRQRDMLYEEERARLVNHWPRLHRRP